MIGLWPGPFFKVIEKPVKYLVARVDPTLAAPIDRARPRPPDRRESRAVPNPQEFLLLAPEILLATAGLVLLLLGTLGRA